MRAASIKSRGSVMKKFRNRKIASGNPKAVCASQMPQYPLFRCPWSRKSLRSGTSDVWIGTIISPTITRKIVSRNGNGTQAKPKAASAPIESGRSVAGIVMIRLFTHARPMWMFCAWITAL